MTRVPRSEKTTGLKFHGVERVVSGGQTGVDQSALDVAIELGIEHGGFCPLGRLCETGKIPAKYQLKELSSPDYAARTLQNVKDSDGTLILYVQKLSGGTALTGRYAREQRKPLYRVRMDTSVDYQQIIDWLWENSIRVLNIAGPRASSNPGIEQLTRQVLRNLFASQSLFDTSWST
ncbi:MAG: putative molybdenum carrier protein [Pirellulales bacterium]